MSRQPPLLVMALFAAAFAANDPLFCGVSKILECGQAQSIVAKAYWRDSVRSSRELLVKAGKLRWVCLTLLLFVSWAGPTRILPVLTAQTPTERNNQERGRQHKTLTY